MAIEFFNVDHIIFRYKLITLIVCFEFERNSCYAIEPTNLTNI